MKKNNYLIKSFFILILIITSIYTWNNLNNNNVIKDYLVLIDDPEIYEKTEEKDIIDNYRTKYNNEEIVGEISFVNTDYKKVIVKHKDNEYYLNHTENKKSSFMGAIFLDYRVNLDTSKKILIYGHNSSKVNMPFKILDNYYSYNYYLEHQYVQILTSKKTKLFKIFSVYVETSDFDYMKTDFKDDEEWYNHITKFKNKSLYNTNTDISKEDNILILQTCSTHKNYKKYKDKFLLVIAKEVQ